MTYFPLAIIFGSLISGLCVAADTTTARTPISRLADCASKLQTAWRSSIMTAQFRFEDRGNYNSKQNQYSQDPGVTLIWDPKDQKFLLLSRSRVYSIPASPPPQKDKQIVIDMRSQLMGDPDLLHALSNLEYDGKRHETTGLLSYRFDPKNMSYMHSDPVDFPEDLPAPYTSNDNNSPKDIQLVNGLIKSAAAEIEAESEHYPAEYSALIKSQQQAIAAWNIKIIAQAKRILSYVSAGTPDSADGFSASGQIIIGQNSNLNRDEVSTEKALLEKLISTPPNELYQQYRDDYLSVSNPTKKGSSLINAFSKLPICTPANYQSVIPLFCNSNQIPASPNEDWPPKVVLDMNTKAITSCLNLAEDPNDRKYFQTLLAALEKLDGNKSIMTMGPSSVGNSSNTAR